MKALELAKYLLEHPYSEVTISVDVSHKNADFYEGRVFGHNVHEAIHSKGQFTLLCDLESVNCDGMAALEERELDLSDFTLYQLQKAFPIPRSSNMRKERFIQAIMSWISPQQVREARRKL